MKKVKGFSLIEVIVAIVLLGIVATGIMPTLSFSYRNLRQSQVFTQDTYDYQEKMEQLIEEKKGEDPTDPLTTKTVTIFGKSITGHIIRVNDKASSDMTVFVAKDSIPNVVPVIAAAPEIKVYNGAMLHTPVTPLDMTNASLTMSSVDPLITNETKPSFLMFVYRWYLSDEMDRTATAPTKTKEYTAIKEWNEAKAALTFEQSNNLSFIPNIEADYNKLNISSLRTALALSEEEWINQFGNRYVMYGVTPYATSGRIGKEMLSNKVYIEAPKLTINSAKFTANNRIVEVTFNNDIQSDIEVDKILPNASLGTIVSAVRSGTDSKVIHLTFDQNLPTNTSVAGNQILRGGVSHATYGDISIWGEGQPDGRFTIQPYVPIIATSLTVSPTTAVLDLDEEIQLTATMLPAGANEALQWISSNTNVATVVDGLVTAKAFGSATITVRTLDGRLSATSAITVDHIPLIVKAGYLKDDGHAGTQVNKVYVEFDGAITHVNLAALNQNHMIRLARGSNNYDPIDFEIVWSNPNAIILYFTAHNIGASQLTIKGERIKIDGEFSDFTASISNEIIGRVTYRIHAKHTINTGTKYIKAFNEDQIGQYQWDSNDLSQRWIIRDANSQNRPINRFKLLSDRYFNLINKSYGEYLEVNNQNNTDEATGQKVYIGSDSNNVRQRYKLVRINNGGEYFKVFTVTRRNRNNYFDSHVFAIHNGSTENGGPTGNVGKLIRFTENNGNTPYQQFNFEPVIELIN